jgi:hypothetical protein
MIYTHVLQQDSSIQSPLDVLLAGTRSPKNKPQVVGKDAPVLTCERLTAASDDDSIGRKDRSIAIEQPQVVDAGSSIPFSESGSVQRRNGFWQAIQGFFSSRTSRQPGAI